MNTCEKCLHNGCCYLQEVYSGLELENNIKEFGCEDFFSFEIIAEEKQKLIDDFREKIVDEIMRKCNYNDFSKLCLVTIVETIDKIHGEIEI